MLPLGQEPAGAPQQQHSSARGSAAAWWAQAGKQKVHGWLWRAGQWLSKNQPRVDAAYDHTPVCIDKKVMVGRGSSRIDNVLLGCKTKINITLLSNVGSN